MAVMVKSTSKLPIVKKKDAKEFLKKYNSNKPKKDFISSCRKAGKLFGEAK